MNRLEEELLAGFDEDGETFEFAGPWLKCPADLDKLVKSQNTRVREVVASIGRDKDLDVLVNDPQRDVRLQVAEWGRDKDADVLVNDFDPCIREEITRQGRPRHLDLLIDDPDYSVRSMVAFLGRDKDLDRLVADPNWRVRESVAIRGRGRIYADWRTTKAKQSVKKLPASGGCKRTCLNNSQSWSALLAVGPMTF